MILSFSTTSDYLRRIYKYSVVSVLPALVNSVLKIDLWSCMVSDLSWFILPFWLVAHVPLPAQYANLSGLTRGNRKREFNHLLILEWKKKTLIVLSRSGIIICIALILISLIAYLIISCNSGPSLSLSGAVWPRESEMRGKESGRE